MKIALGSMFRNSCSYLDRYFDQVADLQMLLESKGSTLELVIAEGDSYDRTYDELLKRIAGMGILLKREHGGKHNWVGNDNADRWRCLAWVCNGILEHVPADVDAFIYVESDLGWASSTMIRLLRHLEEHPVVAPMCFTAVNDFYDIWGHIGMDGVNFIPFPPYHESLGAELTEIASAGSCLVFRGDVIRAGVRFDSVDHVRGLGRDIREKGFSLWVDPTVRVIHY